MRVLAFPFVDGRPLFFVVSVKGGFRANLEGGWCIIAILFWRQRRWGTGVATLEKYLRSWPYGPPYCILFSLEMEHKTQHTITEEPGSQAIAGIFKGFCAVWYRLTASLLPNGIRAVQGV